MDAQIDDDQPLEPYPYHTPTPPPSSLALKSAPSAQTGSPMIYSVPESAPASRASTPGLNPVKALLYLPSTHPSSPAGPRAASQSPSLSHPPTSSPLRTSLTPTSSPRSRSSSIQPRYGHATVQNLCHLRKRIGVKSVQEKLSAGSLPPLYEESHQKWPTNSYLEDVKLLFGEDAAQKVIATKGKKPKVSFHDHRSDIRLS
jgi:hypothetical protein